MIQRAAAAVLLVSLCSCANDKSIATDSRVSPPILHPIGTYQVSDVVTELFSRTFTKDLYWYILYPVDAPIDAQLPCIILFSGGGYNITQFNADTDPPHLQLMPWADIVSAGAVVVGIENRAASDIPRPWNPEDRFGDTDKRRAIRAMIDHDQPEGIVKWVTENLDRPEFRIDPNAIFAAGWSAGGTSTIAQVTHFPDVFRGGIGFTCGFGHDRDPFTNPPTSPDSTADVREQFTEEIITPATQPLLLFLTGDDFFIGGRWNARLAEHVADIPQVTVLWKDEGNPVAAGHDGPQHWGNITVDSEVISTMEYCRRWINSIIG